MFRKTDRILVTAYEYDAAKRLIREKITGKAQGMDVSNDLRLVRNNAGIITATIQKNPQLAQQGIDSVITRVNYNSSTQRYTSKVFEIGFFGFSTIDSAIFTYDANGKIISEEHYLGSPSLGLPLELTLRNDFTLNSNGSVSEMKMYSKDQLGGSMDLLATFKYTFDSKVSPMILSAGEAGIIGRPDATSPNNAVKVDFQDIGIGGLSSFVMDITYTYTSQNNPATSRATGGAIITNSTYYYQ